MRKILFSSLLTSLLIFAPTYLSAQDVSATNSNNTDSTSNWSNSFAFGLNFTEGNSKTTLASIITNTKYESDAHIFDLGISYYFGEDRAVEEPNDDVTRNDFRLSTSYKKTLSEIFYLGSNLGFLYDEIADIDYRVTPGLSFGYFPVKNDDVQLSLEAGPTYLFEKVAGVSDDYLSPRLANRLDWKISETAKLYQTAEIFFDIEDSENYIFNAEVGLETAINSSISLVLSARESYDNQPADDKEPDDLTLMTAIKISL